MPPLPGFSDNPLVTRDDVVRAAEAILRPLTPHFSPAKALVKIPYATGAHFDETAAQLEGFARPLWVIGALLMSGEAFDRQLVQQWIDGFEAGTDPNHPEYWGPLGDHDQRMVEAEMVSFSLLAAPREELWGKFNPRTQRNVTDWLLAFNSRSVWPSNWLWFRVFANLALIKVCNVDNPDVRRTFASDLDTLDTFYLTDGWSGDGKWRPSKDDDLEWQILTNTGRVGNIHSSRNACYYSGSFAIQFSQLLYIRFASDLDPVRAEKYRQQARDFGAGFWRYFDSSGAAIPFGRSLIYRFSCGAFFAALAIAKVPGLPSSLESPGAVKGFLLRHLRWWARNSADVFSADGSLNLGYLYPNMHMMESYNSPQSVYWALKSLVVVALSADDDFWTQPETDFPTIPGDSGVKLLPGPQQILCNHPDGRHHFLLSTAQFLNQPFKGVMAKYSKFAYSSAFGFSVPSGSLGLGQIAPDSMLALSRDGTETWAVKYICNEPSFATAKVCGSRPEEVPTSTVQWYPWADRAVVIRTTIVPPTSRWPDWHVRVHRIRATKDIERLFTAEGGFALHGQQEENHLALPLLEALREQATAGQTEGFLLTDDSVLIMSRSGASGIVTEDLAPPQGQTTVAALKPEPNTNLMFQRSLIPLIEHTFGGLSPKANEVVLVTKVFAVAGLATHRNPSLDRNLRARWLDRPVLSFDDVGLTSNTDLISLNGP
ncbi:hypothetical protein F5X68DRAFT_167385 [Plectosphaerella plurivora]|uniref:DUF2264 domain-containing protein n=1 Tax=Plectosphaerella plurivora TaxID=936078 RepID=A0A9P9ADM2_9PEZI|nr:hypothetical protein F5X68DRAFT_167385 [Plectosphaerella plurivora]